MTAHTLHTKLLNGRRDVSIYTPPGYASSRGPYNLVILFDGPAYGRQPPARIVDEDLAYRIGALTALDNLLAAGRIRPTIACLVAYTPDGARPELNHEAYPEVIATELLPWIWSMYAVSKDPKDVVIGGYSAGAGAAARIALKYPSLFGNVLMQSGNMPAGRLIPLYLSTPRQAIRFYQDVGVYEDIPNGLPALRAGEEPLQPMTISAAAWGRRLRDVLEAKGYEVTYVESGGDHDDIHWRVNIAEGLQTLLRIR